MEQWIQWLLEGDIFIVYQTKRDLLFADDEELHRLKSNILKQGVGKILMDKQDITTGMWALGVYSPKYTSTHYTLLELCQMGADLTDPRCQKGVKVLLDHLWEKNGKVKPYRHQDLCVAAMMLRMGVAAQINDDRLDDIIDYIVKNQMKDGGWNCRWEAKPSPKQSSLHTTLTVLEAIAMCLEKKYPYYLLKWKPLIEQGAQVMIKKRFFRSERTQAVIDSNMLLFRYPPGWRYDILRALDCFRELKIPYHPHMEEALTIIKSKMNDQNQLSADKRIAGFYHCSYERVGQPSRFNTLRAQRVLKAYSSMDKGES
jgi:hypothetical protein